MAVLKWLRSKFLGAGTYGSVYRAECVSYNSTRIVAVKSSLQKNSWSLKWERAVLDELKGCKEIVHCFTDEDFSSIEYDKGYMYNIVLEYANGGTLGQLMESRGGLMPEYEASWYSCMLLKGLSHVHHKGFVHCDMKPDNVLVFDVPFGEYKGVMKYNLKLADFGLAKLSGEITCGAGHEYKNRGSLLYSSPESVVFGVHEAPMDIWSLGCMVLEMLLGEGGLWNRFLDVDEQCLAELIANYEDNRLSLLLPKFECLSVNAKDFVRRCLTTTVQNRWTAEELLKHPFITHNQNLLKKLEAELAYEKMMKYQSNTPISFFLRSSHISMGVC
ncbi:Mitogen-activated protein kinase kinase kinase yoda [Heracleum sosnowskyi]|uniref:Mitogen-activated protein kinase kinase kinase yoda n=1 Tax=Heracleum sosnowskyi TaxID=360622 RepID=A0AAD8J9P9_9APIA|nr:Mitogen-activated protein kinase kinase kinase yoda [Heracleum sosnowskyi]